MSETISKSESTIMDVLIPGLRNYMRISSPDPITGDMVEKNHEVKPKQFFPKSQPAKSISLNKPFCANCGNPVEVGMFCSDSCESQIFGIPLPP